MISEAPVIESKDRNQEISELSSKSTAEGLVEQGAVEHPTNYDDGFRTSRHSGITHNNVAGENALRFGLS